MAIFLKSWEITSENEGWYSNDKEDPGKETYRGISRRYHPNWDGWQIVDECKQYNDFRLKLKFNEKLNNMVTKFYIINFWNVIKGDDIIPQQIANKLFDLSVNIDCPPAIKYMQKALLLEDIDGIVGPETLRVINLCSTEDKINNCLYKFCRHAESYYYARTKDCNKKKLIDRLWRGVK